MYFWKGNGKPSESFSTLLRVFTSGLGARISWMLANIESGSVTTSTVNGG